MEILARSFYVPTKTYILNVLNDQSYPYRTCIILATCEWVLIFLEISHASCHRLIIILWNELYFVSVNDRVAASWQILTFPLDGFNPFSSLLFPSLLSEQQQQQRWVSEHWDDQSEFLRSNHWNVRTILMNVELLLIYIKRVSDVISNFQISTLNIESPSI